MNTTLLKSNDKVTFAMRLKNDAALYVNHQQTKDLIQTKINSIQLQ